MGFEPTRGDPIGLAVQRLNHSATSSRTDIGSCKEGFVMSLQYVNLIPTMKLTIVNHSHL